MYIYIYICIYIYRMCIHKLLYVHISDSSFSESLDQLQRCGVEGRAKLCCIVDALQAGIIARLAQFVHVCTILLMI